MGGGEGSNKVVFAGADAPFGGEGAVNSRGDKLDGEGDFRGGEEGAELLGRFIVHDELGKGMSFGLEEGEDGLEGGEAVGGGFGSLGGEADVAVEVGDQYVLVACARLDGEATRQPSGRKQHRRGEGR